MKRAMELAAAALSRLSGKAARHSPAARFDAALADLASFQPSSKPSAAAAAGAPPPPSARPPTPNPGALDAGALEGLAAGMFDGSDGGAPDPAQAYQLWALAADKGSTMAAARLAAAKADGAPHMPRDSAGCRRLLERLINSPAPQTPGVLSWAQFNLSCLLLRDVAEAALHEDALAAALAPGLPPPPAPIRLSTSGVNMQLIPERVRAGHPDLRVAVALLQHLAALDTVPSAWHNLATAYAMGVGMDAPDPGNAVTWMRHAASRRDAVAAVTLATWYTKGLHGVPPDECAALSLWRVAAELGHPIAQYNVGVAYVQGFSFTTPRPMRVAAPAPGASGGSPTEPSSPPPPPPQQHRVLMQLPVVSPPQSAAAASPAGDLPAALVWFTLASKAGYPLAMMNAAAILQQGGEGVPPDAAAARAWYASASETYSRLLAVAEEELGVRLGEDQAGDAAAAVPLLQGRIEQLRRHVQHVQQRALLLDAPQRDALSGMDREQLMGFVAAAGATGSEQLGEPRPSGVDTEGGSAVAQAGATSTDKLQ